MGVDLSKIGFSSPFAKPTLLPDPWNQQNIKLHSIYAGGDQCFALISTDEVKSFDKTFFYFVFVPSFL